MGMAENIDALLVKYDIPQARLADIAGVAESSVTRWRKGGQIRKENLRRIMDYFNLTEDDILSTTAGLAAKEHGTYQPDIPSGFLPIHPCKTVPIPVVDHVHAGMPTDPDEADYILEVPEVLIIPNEVYVGYIVDGDCMNKIYPEGCLIVIRLTKDIPSGSIGVFRIDGYQTVMRRVYRGANTLILSPESYNPDNKDIIITEESGQTVEAVGIVIWFQAREELN